MIHVLVVSSLNFPLGQVLTQVVPLRYVKNVQALQLVFEGPEHYEQEKSQSEHIPSFGNYPLGQNGLQVY